MANVELSEGFLAKIAGWEAVKAARLLLAGGTMAVLGTALAAAATATALMLLAVGVIYYLLTQVLGMKLDLDPQMFMQPARRYQSSPSAPN